MTSKFQFERSASRGRTLIPSHATHVRREGVVERSIDCMRGSPWREADVGNAFYDLFTGNDPENPDGVFAITVDHWEQRDRVRAVLQLYQGNSDCHLLVFHHEIDEQTRACAVCNKVVGTPIAERREVVADKIEWIDDLTGDVVPGSGGFDPTSKPRPFQIGGG